MLGKCRKSDEIYCSFAAVLVLQLMENKFLKFPYPVEQNFLKFKSMINFQKISEGRSKDN